MNEDNPFLKALAENEDDITTRLVYADWLDEHGQHEEADRQRKWPAAKEWLVRFCDANNVSVNEYESSNEYETVISYQDLLDYGRRAVNDDNFWLSCGNNDIMCDALRSQQPEFWTNWSILTGIPVPADAEEKSQFSCAC